LNSAPRPGELASGGVDAPDLRLFVFALFFVFGGITSLNDILIPKLRELFTLSYAQAMLVQSAFFAAYFLVSVPASAAVQRLGYMRTAVVGVLTMAAGCLLFVPASASGTFTVFLGALFILAAGITTVQVVANPLISMLGQPGTAHSRLTFAQAFNSLGTTIFPYVGSILILGSLATVTASMLSGAELDAYRQQESQVIGRTYTGIAIALMALAALIFVRRHRLVETPVADIRMRKAFTLLKRPRFGFGALAIFLYVGAEVAIGSLIVNYLMQHDTMALGEQAAGKHVPLYWGGALLGRFIGAWLLRLVSPGKLLAAVAAGSITLIAMAILTQGPISGWALLAIGLCNSIMFPTIFSLASEGLGSRAAEGSGVICMAIVGGAIVPPLTGHIADLAGLRLSLLLPALCYAIIAGFGLYARRPAT
jgi:FHS family L-fucose permease-like MFS transporter